MYRKIISIAMTGLVFFNIAYIHGAGENAADSLQAALWGAAGAGVMCYWPRRSVLQIISLCWLGILLFGFGVLSIIHSKLPSEAPRDYPNAEEMLFVMSVPFLMVILPFVVLTIRSAYRDHMRTVLEEAVLAATNPLSGPEEGAMEKARRLLKKGTYAAYIPDAMVERDELLFEAVDTPNPQAVKNAQELLPLLGKAGASISQAALDSSRYNCPPVIQEELKKLPCQS